MSNEQIDGNKSSGYLDTIDIPQAQTKARLDREEEIRKETYRQQQERLRTQRRHAWISTGIACLIVAVTLLYVIWSVQR